MISNNTTDVSLCPDRDWFTKYGQQASFLQNYVISPITHIIAGLMHAVCLKAFHTQVKKENGYAYQIIATVNDVFVLFSAWIYLIVFQMLANPHFDGPFWYKTCYSCMWFTKLTGTSFINTFYTMSLFFTISMSADRLYALWKPMSYKITNTKRNLISSICISFIIAVLVNLMDCFSYTVQSIGKQIGPWEIYVLQFNPSPLIKNLNTVRTFIQTLCIPVLYFCNIALLRFYRIRQVETAMAMNLSKKEKRTREIQKTLTLLAICQCVWVTFQVTSASLSHLAVYLSPTFSTCSGLLIIPVRQAITGVFYLIYLFTPTIISKPFRNMILQELPYFKGRVTASMANTTMHGQQNQQNNEHQIGRVTRLAW